LFSRNERGARDEALSEWSENNEFMRLGGGWGEAPKNFFENCSFAIYLLSEFGFIGFKGFVGLLW
jgi:hypothetical protein